MIRSTASKVMWVGRATVFLVGLAVILALLFGVASTALGKNGKPFILGKNNAATKVSTLVKRGVGPALGLVVRPGEPPMKVNSSGKVANLNADAVDGKSEADFYAAGSKVADSDKLDGKDSDEILPLVRAQNDASPLDPVRLSGNIFAESNSVAITAPADGVLVISANMVIFNLSADTPVFTTRVWVDGQEVVMAENDDVPPGKIGSLSPNVTVPVSTGHHTVTLRVERLAAPLGSWGYDQNNLTAMFVPAARGSVTTTGS